jgi:hypothetical protein
LNEMSMRNCCLLTLALLCAPSLAAAQSPRIFAGAGAGVTSVPRAGDAGCGGKPDKLIGFSGEVRAGVRTGALEVAVRAARVFQGAHTAYDCVYPPMGIHTSYVYEDLDDVATTLDANAWYSLLPGGWLKVGAEAGVVPGHSAYAGAGAALGLVRNRVRLELTGRMHRIEFTEVVNNWNDTPVREISRTDKTETLPGLSGRLILVLP